MLAVGNVGESLAPYTDSDIFLTRDGGFTWEEIHKDAHMWEFGDSGSVIVLVNDEEATDHVIYSTDEGLSWSSYSFGETLRIRSIQTVPQDTSRRFVLLGVRPGETSKSVLVHLDFSAITQTKCTYIPSLTTRTSTRADALQACSTSKTPIMTISSSGVRARAATRLACLADRHCITAVYVIEAVMWVSWWTSPRPLCATAPVPRRTLNGEFSHYVLALSHELRY